MKDSENFEVPKHMSMVNNVELLLAAGESLEYSFVTFDITDELVNFRAATYLRNLADGKTSIYRAIAMFYPGHGDKIEIQKKLLNKITNKIKTYWSLLKRSKRYQWNLVCPSIYTVFNEEFLVVRVRQYYE